MHEIYFWHDIWTSTGVNSHSIGWILHNIAPKGAFIERGPRCPEPDRLSRSYDRFPKSTTDWLLALRDRTVFDVEWLRAAHGGLFRHKALLAETPADPYGPSVTPAVLSGWKRKGRRWRGTTWGSGCFGGLGLPSCANHPPLESDRSIRVPRKLLVFIFLTQST